MKVVVLTCDQPNQVALCQKVARVSDLAAIVFSANRPRKQVQRKTADLLRRAGVRLVGWPLTRSWLEMMRRYRELYPSPPEAEVVRVENVNDAGTFDALARHDPGLVMVSGTNLVGRKTITAASNRLGIVNLHTGISPFVKGGPDCTNWCLARREFHLIGNTVMWLDPGIDTGSVIATERTPLDGGEGPLELRWQVMEHGHDLYVRTIQAIAAGRTVSRVPQEALGEGPTYYNADWGPLAALKAVSNYRFHYNPRHFQTVRFREAADAVRLVALESGETAGASIKPPD